MKNFKPGDLVEIARNVHTPKFGSGGWTANKGTLGVIIKPWQRKQGKLYVVHLSEGHKGIIPEDDLKRVK